MTIVCIFFESPTEVAKIAELFLRYSPQICLRKDRAIFIEIGKCHRLFTPESFIARARVLLRRLALQARIGVGHNICESLAHAIYQRKFTEIPLSSLTEIIDPFSHDEFIRKNTLDMIQVFRDLGIKTIGQFQNLPVHALIARFGVLGRLAFERVHFTSQIPWPSWQPAEIIQEKKEFPYFEFYGELDPILFELKSHLDLVFQRLSARGRRATRIEIKIRCEKTSTHPHFLRTLEFQFFTPQSQVKGTLRIIKERLAREFEKNPINSPIEEITTKVLKSVAAGDRQKNMLNNTEEKFEELSSVQNQLAEILGRENIFQAELLEDRRPEHSWKKNCMLSHAPSDKHVDTTRLPERTLYLCKTPIKIEITAGFVHIRQKRYRIMYWDNSVEILEGGWFENALEKPKNTYLRNYHHVVLQGNQRVTIFQNQEREYFLHGYSG